MGLKNILAVFVVLSIGSSRSANSDSGVDPVASFPRLVMVYYNDAILGHIRGTLVKPDRVIVPAHCVIDKNPKQMLVVAGTTLLHYGGINQSVAEMHIDPNYNSKTRQNDYAVLKLNRPFVEEHRGTLDLCPAIPQKNPSTSRYSIQLPKTMQSGNKVRIIGRLQPDAKQFSINFGNEIAEPIKDIIYHFKFDLIAKKIIENFKIDDEWMNHLEKPSPIDMGDTFSLEFIFTNIAFSVYTTQGNLIAYYEPPHFDVTDIRSVHVWGDVEKIEEFTLLYSEFSF